MAVAQFCSGGVAICYVLPVLWMTSRLAVMGPMALRGRPDMLALAVSYVRDRAESHVYECLVTIESNVSNLFTIHLSLFFKTYDMYLLLLVQYIN